MTVRVGALSSQVEVQGGGAASAGGSGAGSPGGSGPLQPTWAERERHQHLAEADRRDRERVAGEGFGG